MKSAEVPANEAARLRALHAYGLVDRADDEALNALVRVAAAVCEAPIALLSLVEEERQFFLASVGLPGATETPRERAFCAQAILSSELMVVEDASRDDRFSDSSLVTGDPFVRFYAGCPLIDDAGFALGTLCVLDRTPRTLTPLQTNVLRELSKAVMRILAAKRDERMLLAAESVASRAKDDLFLVLDAIPTPIAYWTADLNNAFANRGFLQGVDRSRESVRNHHARDVLGAERFARHAPAMEAALRGEPQRLEHTVKDGDGTRHFIVTLMPDDRDGHVRGFLEVANDVSELKAALLLSEQRNNLLALAEEMANVGHWCIEAGEQSIYWSPQVYRIYGKDPATFEPSVQGWLAAVHPDDRELAAAQLSRTMQDRQPFEFERRIVRPDGAVRTVVAKARFELDAAGGATNTLVGVVQDVTDRNALRERLARKERLLTTGTLAAGVAHEINNPLTSVASNLEFVIDEMSAAGDAPLSARAKETLEILGEARQGAERIREIVRGLTAFARDDLTVGPTDVLGVIEMSLDMTANELRRATLIKELGTVGPVMAEETRLSQAVVHLLMNAAQAFATNDPDRNRVVVRTMALAGERVAIEVEDNGPGIEKEVLPRVFDPFFTTKAVGERSGLGLAVSHDIVSAFGGELSCSTEPGKGTTFRIVLEVAQRCAAVDGSPPTPRITPRGRVLVIDDEPAVLRTIERALRDEQDVVCSGDSREALRLLTAADTKPFDVVFCDLMMPHLSGMQLYYQARAHDAKLVASFVFLSGGAIDDVAQSFLRDVAIERLAKPFSNRELRALARRYADRHR